MIQLPKIPGAPSGGLANMLPKPEALPPQGAPGGYPPPYAPPQQGAPGGYPPPYAPPQQYAPQGAPGGFPPPAFGGPALDFGAQVSQAQAAGSRLPYFVEGEYLVTVTKTLITTTNPCYVVEFTVDETNRVDVAIGSGRAWIQGLAKPQVAQATIKRFVLSLLGATSDEQLVGHITPQELAALINRSTGAENPFAGMKVRLRVTETLTKEKRPFTRHDFFPV